MGAHSLSSKNSQHEHFLKQAKKGGMEQVMSIL